MFVYKLSDSGFESRCSHLKIHQFKANDSESKRYPWCLRNISKEFSVDNMKKTGHKIMLGINKKMYIVLLSSIVIASNHTKCLLLSHQKYMIQPTLINLHPNEYSQEFHYYPFSVKLDRCAESCNNLNDLSNKVCVPNKTEDLNLNVFNMIAGINKSKVLTKHISCKCKCRFDGRNCNSDQWWNNDKC